MKNMKSEIFSVYPPTTASCMNSIRTGLNPSEHGLLGYSIYIPPINKIITLFGHIEKGKFKVDKDFSKINYKYYYNNTSITQLIKNRGKYLNIDKGFEKILETLKIPEKKYIFSTFLEPDNILHIAGPKSEKVIDVIQKINNKVEEYSKLILEHEKILMIISADHGHLTTTPNKISFSSLYKYLKSNKLFIENRAPTFLVKPSYIKEFIKEFNKNFGKDFFFVSKKEILKHKIYGEYSVGTKHKFLENSIGDFMGITKDSSNKLLFGEGVHDMASYHEGNSDDEICIPLIVISN